MAKQLFLICAGLLMVLIDPFPSRAETYLGFGSSSTHAMGESNYFGGFKAFAGYTIRPFLGIEGGYRNVGTIEKLVTDMSSNETSYKMESDGWDIQGLGRVAIGDLELFAKAGAYFGKTKTETDDTPHNVWDPASVHVHEEGTALIWGAGLGARFGLVGFRLEWEKIEVKTPNDLSSVSVGITFLL